MTSLNIDPQSARANPVFPPAEEIYYGLHSGPNPTKLRIATGGAGQSGLIHALADAFIVETCARDGEAPFGVAWLKSDTTASFNYLAQNAADVSITYHGGAEEIAIQQGIADRRVYAWRDHWLLVGPAADPASLPVSSSSPDLTIHMLFAHLFRAAVSTQDSSHPVRFLSRWDKSAGNIKESSIWTAIGMVPWAEPKSEWYRACRADPFEALRIARERGEYTLTDRGTWIVGQGAEWGMRVFMEGGDDEDEILLNPAHVLVGKYGANKEMADKFADWMGRRDGGQEIVKGFAVNGQVLYSMAPGMESEGR